MKTHQLRSMVSLAIVTTISLFAIPLTVSAHSEILTTRGLWAMIQHWVTQADHIVIGAAVMVVLIVVSMIGIVFKRFLNSFNVRS